MLQKKKKLLACSSILLMFGLSNFAKLERLGVHLDVHLHYNISNGLYSLVSYLYSSEFLYTSVKLMPKVASCSADITSNIQVVRW